jgi:hypothetical protein
MGLVEDPTMKCIYFHFYLGYMVISDIFDNI